MAGQSVVVRAFSGIFERGLIDMVRAKFRVDSVTNFGGGTGRVELSPVTGGSDENVSFWKYTPAGKIEMHVDNPETLVQFAPGQEFYVDFTPAE